MGRVEGCSPSFAGVLLPKKCRNDECDWDRVTSPGSDTVGVIDTNDAEVGLELLSTDAIDSLLVERWLCLNAS